MGKNTLLELLLEERMNGALEQNLTTNAAYKDTDREIEKMLKKLEKMELSKKQYAVVDNLFSAYNYNSSEYGRAAYRLGFKDGLMLMQELDELREYI